jgi:quercetin dioxygenase-like cupin family protein
MAKLFEDYGKFPVDPVKARKDKELIKIAPEMHKHLVHGKENHVHVSLISSTNYAQVGHITLAPKSHSELENHNGDEVIYMKKGRVAIRVVWHEDLEADAKNVNRHHFELNEGEAFLIPEGYVHQYINLMGEKAVMFFGIGPDF